MRKISFSSSKTLLNLMPLGVVLVTSGFISVASAQDQNPTLPAPAPEAETVTPSRLPMQAGDIMLEGTIVYVSQTKRELVLLATRFTLPSGRAKELPAPRYKLVSFAANPLIAAAPYPGDGSAPLLLDTAALVLSHRLAVVGPDSGTGQIMAATLFEVGDLDENGPQNNTIPAPPVEEPVKKTFPVKLTRYFGGVPEHVAATGLRVGQKFGIHDIGGKAPRADNPNSDHPRGLALDFMVGRNAAMGDHVAAYFEANAELENVAYIIWKDNLVYPGDRTDWKALVADYGPGFTKRHMDHVHVSFLEQPTRPGPYVTDALQRGAELASRSGKRKHR